MHILHVPKTWFFFACAKFPASIRMGIEFQDGGTTHKAMVWLLVQQQQIQMISSIFWHSLKRQEKFSNLIFTCCGFNICESHYLVVHQHVQDGRPCIALQFFVIIASLSRCTITTWSLVCLCQYHCPVAILDCPLSHTLVLLKRPATASCTRTHTLPHA